MTFFYELADALLKMQDYTIFTSPKNGEFGFKYMSDYSGLMARPPKTGKNANKIKNPKQGLFDITVIAGTRYPKAITHRNLLEDIIQHSNLENCLRVWRGEDPRTLDVSIDEKETLVTMALLMFEQEVNWGDEEWQKFSHFTPKKKTPAKIRPRDMIMGFVRQAFDFGVDAIKFWMKIRPGTVCFSNPDDKTQSDYSRYPEEYKRYFTELETMTGTDALMTGKYRELFRQKAQLSPNNPSYSS